MNSAPATGSDRRHDCADAAWLVTISRDPASGGVSTGGHRSDNGVHAVHFHGTLFDRADLAGVLGVCDATDADLVRAAYARWGEGALQKLRGAFAAVIIDSRARTAFVVRDPLGSHPLFYAARGEDIVVADAADPIARRAGAAIALNRVAMAEHLCHRWPEPTETFFDGVFRVPPGHRIRINASGLRLDRYWDPAPLERPVDFIDAREVGRFDALLDRAVARGLDGTHTGVFLSGGLDSISIAAVAADLTRRSGEAAPHALSLAFPDPGCDERAVQQSVAQALGLRMHLLDFHEATGPTGLLEQSIALNSRLSSPLLNTWAPAYLQLARGGATSGVRTIMTGSGGDEWLSVSPFLGADLLKSGRIDEFSRFLIAWRRSYRFSSPMSFLRSAFWTYSLRPLAGAALDTVAPTRWQRRRAHRATASDPSWVAPDPALSRMLRERAPRSLGASRPAHGFYFQEVRTGLDHPLTSLELEEQYQFGSWLGVRFHHPYWDADLVDMLYRTPPHLLNRGGRSKGLVRDTVARRFPSLGFERQRKVLATSFYRAVLFAEAPAVANRYGDCRTLNSLGVVDGKAAERMVRDTLSPPHRDAQSSAHLHRVWDLLNLEAWARSRVA